jgi:hypothetical protein
VVNACTNEVYVIRPKEKSYSDYANERFEKHIEFDSNVDAWDCFTYNDKVYDINLDYYDAQVGLMVAIYDAPKEGADPYMIEHKIKLTVVTNQKQWDKAINNI